MRERLKSRKGFTLAELLIVVAIIAVLVAIMLPVFGSSRENAILAKDAANIRSLYAEAVVDEMTKVSYSGEGFNITIDNDKAKVTEGTTVSCNGGAGGDITVTRSGKSITIEVDDDVTVSLANF